jgi:predicted RNase H-like nuclease (RuvC/YqgF family)
MYVNLQKIENSATTPCRCATLEKENEMLKEQIAHMKERITDLEKENATNVKDSEKIEKEIKILAKLSKLDLKGSLEKLDELDKMIPSTVFSSIASNVKE